jgi:hypothetical protein
MSGGVCFRDPYYWGLCLCCLLFAVYGQMSNDLSCLRVVWCCECWCLGAVCRLDISSS